MTRVHTIPYREQRRYTVHLLERGARFTILITCSIMFLMPFVWLVITSLKQPSQMFTWPPELLPHPPRLQNYVDVFTLAPMGRYLLNTLKIELLAVPGSVLTSAMVAYGFARLRAPGLNWLFGLCLATLMLPSQVTMIPTFLIFSHIGWIDTHLPLWVPAWFGGGAWNIFLLKQFFSTIPRELEEAALMDGASRFTIFWRIILPLSKPALVVVTIFAVQYVWNDLFNPLIYLNRRENYTLALGLTTFQGAQVTALGPLMAASVLMTLPMIVVYFVAQRHIAQGIVLTRLSV